MIRSFFASVLLAGTFTVVAPSSPATAAPTCPPDVATMPFLGEVNVALHKPGDFGNVAPTTIELIQPDGTRTVIGDTGACPTNTNSADLPLNGIGINPIDLFAYAIEDTTNYFVPPGQVPLPEMYRIDADGRVEDLGFTVSRPPATAGLLDAQYVASFVGTFDTAGTYHTLGYQMLQNFVPLPLPHVVISDIRPWIAAVNVTTGVTTWKQIDMSSPPCTTIKNTFTSTYNYASKASQTGPIADFTFDTNDGSIVALSAAFPGANEIRINPATGVAGCRAVNNGFDNPSSLIVGQSTLGGTYYVVNAAGDFGTFDGIGITQVANIGALNGDLAANVSYPYEYDLSLDFTGLTPTDRQSNKSTTPGSDVTASLTLTNQGAYTVGSVTVRITAPGGGTSTVTLNGPIAPGGTVPFTVTLPNVAAGVSNWDVEIIASAFGDNTDRTFYDSDSTAGDGFAAAPAQDDALRIVVTATTPPTTTTSLGATTTTTSIDANGANAGQSTTTTSRGTTTTAGPTTTSNSTSVASALPTTGGSNGSSVALGAVLIFGGGVVLAAATRTRRRQLLS